MVAMKVPTVFLSALLLMSLVPAGEAQIRECGVVQGVFLNPDLNEKAAGGVIEANGAFFAQFQVIGERADEVEYIGFSFGVQTVPQDESACPENEEYNGYYFSGQQVLNYRADTDPSDGFFINLQTTLVPDGEYSAAVHAFDKDDNELGRFWVQAEVDNCSDAAADPSGRCADAPDQDSTIPWPIILPGDGEATVNGFTIEVAEALSDKQVFLNGDDITDELVQWDGRLWDNDLRPGYGPFGLLGDNQVTAECSVPEPQVPNVNECSYLGEAYEWTGRKLVEGDVLNVLLVDMFGNEAKKDIHVGFGITGGISSGAYPILQWTADHVAAEVEAGKSEVFEFTIQNLGAEVGHPFATDDLQVVPEGWDYLWSAHQPVQPTDESTSTFTLDVPADAKEGRHQVTVGMSYKGQGGQDKELQQILNIDVIGGTDENTGVEGDFDGDGIPDDEQKGSPAAGALLSAFALLGAALIAARRSA